MKGKGGLGFKFVGSITLQAFLLQNGLLNGHAPGCWRCARCHPASRCGPVAAVTPAPGAKRRQRAAEEEAPAARGKRIRL